MGKKADAFTRRHHTSPRSDFQYKGSGPVRPLLGGSFVVMMVGILKSQHVFAKS
jgi:hypothetical protein